MDYIKTVIINMRILDFIDIALVSFAFYKVYMIIRETRAKQVLKGIIIILLITRIAELADLHTLRWILTNTLQVGFIALLIVFQPELRKALEYIGRTTFFNFGFFDDSIRYSGDAVEEIVDACEALSKEKTGALIIFERKTGLNDIIETGVIIDSQVSAELLRNIFIPNTPLHDGAVIIKGNKIKAASCFLPLTDSSDLSQDIGTRHRAAMGVTDKSDCVAVIISEETGCISYASEGKLTRELSIEDLEEIIINIYRRDDRIGLLRRWRRRND